MFNSVLSICTKFRTEEECIVYLEKQRWPEGNPVSPFLSWEKVYKLKHHQFKGAITGKVFNVKTGTIFQGSKLPLSIWFAAIGLFCSAKKGISSYQMARHLNISQVSAWKLLMKIRSILSHSNKSQLRGIVQIDELFHGPKGDTRKLNFVKTPVFGLADRRHFIMKVVPDVSKASLYPIIDDYVKKESTIFSDEFTTYKLLNRFGYHHYTCNHKMGVYVNQKTLATTNRIESLWHHFRNMLRNYNTVSKKYLQLYCDEFCWRGNNKKLELRHLFIMTLGFAFC